MVYYQKNVSVVTGRGNRNKCTKGLASQKNWPFMKRRKKNRWPRTPEAYLFQKNPEARVIQASDTDTKEK